ncbi:MAG: peptidyl-prolyl cis-trans isomerase, partial [Clostridiales bacterium]|nr:peptidyl-prolyl cis-trans isomerase [Clostridiales bacterium]
MKKNRIAAVLLAGALGVSTLSGCGINKSAVIASTDGVDVTLGVANFYCRYMQACYEDTYTSYFGSDVWSQDLYGDGSTMEESLKDSVMDELHTMYTLSAHADDYGVSLTDDEEEAITEAAQQFMSDNSDAAIKELGATQDIVAEVLRVYTISPKMQ